MDTLLAKIGVKDFVHYQSSTENYPDCLSLATVDILHKYIDEPLLILEDDVKFTGIDTFDYVEDADAIYFGLSKSAGHPLENRDEGWSQFTYFSNTQVKVKNMLATHAILYISKKYKQEVISTFVKHMGSKYYNDVLLSRLQPQFNVLANTKPSFYQAKEFNDTDHVELFTKIEIEPTHPFTIRSFNI